MKTIYIPNQDKNEIKHNKWTWDLSEKTKKALKNLEKDRLKYLNK
jgi:hypothetical protein